MPSMLLVVGRLMLSSPVFNREHDIRLNKYIKAPDFPTGGTVYGYEGVKEAFKTKFGTASRFNS